MLSNYVRKETVNKIADMPEPWCNFSLDTKFFADISSQDDYDRQDVLRGAINSKFPDDRSITMGRLPPIISPIFWEVLSGKPRSEIMSLKYPGNPITPARYERQKTMAEYLFDIPKIYIVNKFLYRDTIIEQFSLNDLTKKQRTNEIDRRLSALDLFRRRISEGKCPTIIIVVDQDRRTDDSFTVTPHFHARIMRGRGQQETTGTFQYDPEGSNALVRAWSERWNDFLNIARRRSDWDKRINDNTSLDSLWGNLDSFNERSIDEIEEILKNLKWRVRFGPLLRFAEVFDGVGIGVLNVNIEKLKGLFKRK